jgi:amidase
MSHDNISRRAFLARSAAGGAALLTGGFGALLETAAAASSGFAWLEATIPQLQAAMASGQLTSKDLTKAYLDRIDMFNPLLHAVIETNPNAVSIAQQLDNERRKGHTRGPLHGIPILVKDNIATRDNMETTAGSLALVHSRVPGDATLITHLRDAGAVILGKANLGEWANWRGFNPFLFYGWSARGGATHNPYLLSYTSFGSSSGSAVASAMNLCAVAVGTETDGSIIGPSNANLVVGLKPSFGLISGNGIIPISKLQDTAGPMGRSVTDVATLLGVLQSPFGEALGHVLPHDYTQFLQRGSLNGARIGVETRFFDQYDTYGFPGDSDTLPFAEAALQKMEDLGATLVENIDTGDLFAINGNEFAALTVEFKAHIEDYLATLTHTDMRTLGDLIAFNLAHCNQELEFYGQELFEASEASGGDLTDPTYIAQRANARQAARAGLDAALATHDLDAIVGPHLSNSSGPAVSGYPNLALPVGITSAGKPAGILMYSGFLNEPELLAFGYDLEQELKARVQPRFLGAVSDPPNARLCASPHGKSLTANDMRRLARGPKFW